MNNTLIVSIASIIFFAHIHGFQQKEDESLFSIVKKIERNESKRINRNAVSWQEGKQFYLQQAEEYRKDANFYLMKAGNLADIFPDIDMQKKIKTVIASYIGTLAVPAVKEQLLLVCLTCIGDSVADFSIDTFNNYLKFRENLVLAACYLEKCNAYLSMALGAPFFYSENFDVDDYFLDFSHYLEDAVQYLIIADMYCTTLECNGKYKCMSAYIQKIRSKIISEIEKTGGIDSIHSNDVGALSENMGEIFAEIPDYNQDLYEDLSDLLRKVKHLLRKAERALRIPEEFEFYIYVAQARNFCF